MRGSGKAGRSEGQRESDRRSVSKRDSASTINGQRSGRGRSDSSSMYGSIDGTCEEKGKRGNYVVVEDDEEDGGERGEGEGEEGGADHSDEVVEHVEDGLRGGLVGLVVQTLAEEGQHGAGEAEGLAVGRERELPDEENGEIRAIRAIRAIRDRRGRTRTKRCLRRLEREKGGIGSVDALHAIWRFVLRSILRFTEPSMPYSLRFGRIRALRRPVSIVQQINDDHRERRFDLRLTAQAGSHGAELDLLVRVAAQRHHLRGEIVQLLHGDLRPSHQPSPRDLHQRFERRRLAPRSLSVDPHDAISLLLRPALEGAAQRPELLLGGGQLGVDVLGVAEHQLVQEGQEPLQRGHDGLVLRGVAHQRGEEGEDRAAQREVRLRPHRLEGRVEQRGQCRAERGNAEGVEQLGEELVGVGVGLDGLGSEGGLQHGLESAEQSGLENKRKREEKKNVERLEGRGQRGQRAGETGQRQRLRADLRRLRDELRQARLRSHRGETANHQRERRGGGQRGVNRGERLDQVERVDHVELVARQQSVQFRGDERSGREEDVSAVGGSFGEEKRGFSPNRGDGVMKQGFHAIEERGERGSKIVVRVFHDNQESSDRVETVSPILRSQQ